MKTTTTIKYECSDGRTFLDPQTAKEHEVLIAAEALRGETEKRLTAAEIIRLLAMNPERFVAVLQVFTGGGCDKAAGEDLDFNLDGPHDSSFDKAAADEAEAERQGETSTPERGAGGRFKSVRSDTAAE